MSSTMKFALGVALVLVSAVVVVPNLPDAPASLAAQKKKASIPDYSRATKGRLDAMEAAFTLTKEQKNNIKTLMDDAHKTAAPIRDALTTTHAAIGAAIQASKGQPEIDAATKAYAEQATAMMALEMKTLAGIMKELTEEQRASSAAISQTFFAMRSAFLNKNWNDIPDGKNY